MSDDQCIHTIIKAQVGWHVAHFGSDDTGRDRGTARATLGEGLAVSAFPLYVPV
jgi:hypothetical protein